MPEPVTTPQSNHAKPEEYDAILQRADRARASQNRVQAHALYARLVEINSNDSRGWAGLAYTASNTDEAIISWAYTLALAPNSWEARTQMDSHIETRLARSGVADAGVLLALARTLAEVGQKPAAYRIIARATELDPTSTEAWIWRAGITEDPNEAIRCLEHVLTFDPTNAQARAGLEWALTKQRTPQAPVDRTSAASFFAQGQDALQTGNLPAAYGFFVQATERDPANDTAWFWRGSTAPNTSEALVCMERTLYLNPQNQTAKDSLWYLRVKKYREAYNLRTTTAPSTNASNGQNVTPPAPRASKRRLLQLFFIAALIVTTIALVYLAPTQLA